MRANLAAFAKVTAPYLEGPNSFLTQMHELSGPDDARRMVNFWADSGATSFKAYMNITREELRAAAEEAHKRHLKITGHLCSVGFREAAEAGIDNLEHGFIIDTEYIPGKKTDQCPPGGGIGSSEFLALDPKVVDAFVGAADDGLVRPGESLRLRCQAP